MKHIQQKRAPKCHWGRGSVGHWSRARRQIGMPSVCQAKPKLDLPSKKDSSTFLQLAPNFVVRLHHRYATTGQAHNALGKVYERDMDVWAITSMVELVCTSIFAEDVVLSPKQGLPMYGRSFKPCLNLEVSSRPVPNTPNHRRLSLEQNVSLPRKCHHQEVRQSTLRASINLRQRATKRIPLPG